MPIDYSIRCSDNSSKPQNNAAGTAHHTRLHRFTGGVPDSETGSPPAAQMAVSPMAGTYKGIEMIKKGDVVKIKKEWQDAGDDQIVFLACEDEDGGRVLIEPQINISFKPRQVVQVFMLENNE
jgi:hypothetical protein